MGWCIIQSLFLCRGNNAVECSNKCTIKYVYKVELQSLLYFYIIQVINVRCINKACIELVTHVYHTWRHL